MVKHHWSLTPTIESAPERRIKGSSRACYEMLSGLSSFVLHTPLMSAGGPFDTAGGTRGDADSSIKYKSNIIDTSTKRWKKKSHSHPFQANCPSERRDAFGTLMSSPYSVSLYCMKPQPSHQDIDIEGKHFCDLLPLHVIESKPNVLQLQRYLMFLDGMVSLLVKPLSSKGSGPGPQAKNISSSARRRQITYERVIIVLHIIR